jgi:hypothetical protein
MKLCHLHLEDYSGNKKTLVCNLDEGSIRYVFYGGWNDSGTSFSLSNLQCTLPIEKLNDSETKEQFVQRIINTINKDSVVKVVKQISTQITF